MAVRQQPARGHGRAIGGEGQRVPAGLVHVVPFQFHRHALLLDENAVADGAGALAGFGPGADDDGLGHDSIQLGSL
ncbi:hypothetical protein D3C81_1855430 [compost metagenome]